MFVCLGWKVSLLDEGIEIFGNLIHWLMGWVGWASAYWKEECVGDVCPQLSAWSILARRWQRSPANVHPCTIYCSVCVCVCLWGKLFVCSLSVCQGDITRMIWLTSSCPCFSPTSLFPAVEIFRDLKQLEKRTPLYRQTPTPSSLFSADVPIFMLDFCETIWFNSLYVAANVCPLISVHLSVRVWVQSHHCLCGLFFFFVTLGCCSLSRETTVCHSHRNRALFTSP